MSAPDRSTVPAAEGSSGTTRWPLRVVVVAGVVLGVGVWLFPGAKTALLIGFGLALAWAGWSLWDATRGATFALARERQRWLDALGAVDDDKDLHLMEERQPLIVRLDRRGAALTSAVLTPLPETTAAFRIWPRAAPRPGFDGREPPVGGPLLTPLSGLEGTLGGAFTIEGNEPARIARWLDGELVQGLLVTLSLHADTFRGLTFDGRFLAVHWVNVTGQGVGHDPVATLAASSALWRPFVPRLPSATPGLMH